MTLPAHEVPGAKLSHTAAAGQPPRKPIATGLAKNTPQPSPSCQVPHPSSPADRERDKVPLRPGQNRCAEMPMPRDAKDSCTSRP